MKSVMDNIAAKKEAEDAVLAHPMCAAIKKTRTRIIIVYPLGEFPVDGIRAENSAKGLAAALAVMERHWVGSFPGAR